MVKNGDRLMIVTQSPGSPLGTATTTVTVGAFTTAFSVPQQMATKAAQVLLTSRQPQDRSIRFY